MKFSSLVQKLDYKYVLGSKDTSADMEISGVVYDSRKVESGSAFICIRGTARDSHDYIADVIEHGASLVVIEEDHAESVRDLLATMNVDDKVTVISTKDSRLALAIMSAAWFGYPAEKLTTIGITGTKGKTTTSFMIQEVLEKVGFKTGIIGTIGALINGEKIKTGNTTPESYELQKLFAMMVDAGCTHVVMEVSSQGLKMSRVAGVTFDYGIFTNFSADHIGPGEHESMEEYLYCKSLLFKQCHMGIINMDDASWEGVTKEHTCDIMTFGFDSAADLRADSYELVRNGSELGISFETGGDMKAKVYLPVPGKFNIYNALCALSLGVCLGIPQENMLKALAGVHVKGRVEMVPVSGPYSVMIDYAHNEVSVESLLNTVKEYNPAHITCVYGGGGNRSKLRRYAMGELCGKMADLSILTQDNPRDEDISSINADIKVGLAKSNGKYIEIEDRREAIWYAMDNAQPGDLIILLGKGHEDYQEIKGQKYHYSERESVESYEKERHGA